MDLKIKIWLDADKDRYLPGTAFMRWQKGIRQGHFDWFTGVLAVIHQLIGKEDVIVNTADKEGGEGHNENKLPM